MLQLLGLYIRVIVSDHRYFGSFPVTTFWKTATHAATLPSTTSDEESIFSSVANDFMDKRNSPACDLCRTHTHAHTDCRHHSDEFL